MLFRSRMRAQWDAGKPLAKQLWREIVVAKIRWQAAVLEAQGIESGAFTMLARRVRSGDPDNIEAQAARRYWPLLMGEEFRRDRSAEGVNALLNYGPCCARFSRDRWSRPACIRRSVSTTPIAVTRSRWPTISSSRFDRSLTW